MGRKNRCCCPSCGACQIGLDRFGRVDSDDLGDDWSEVVGNWAIEANELVTTDSDALALHQGPALSGLPRHVVTVKLKGDDPGDELRVHVATDDETYGLYAQLVLENGGSCGLLQLWKSASGSDTKLAQCIVPDLVEDEWHTLKVCYRPANNLLVAQLAAVVTTRSGRTRQIAHETTSVGILAGVGAGTITAKAHFDNFCWQRHYIAAADVGDPYDAYDDLAADVNCPSCGLPTCVYAEDDFDRDDSDDLGCQWEEVSGDWEILGESLQANATGLVASTATHPEGRQEMSMTGTVVLPTDGDTVRVIVSYDDDQNYLAMEITAGADCGSIALYSVVAGVETLVSSVVSVAALNPNSEFRPYHTFWVCFGSHSLADTDLYLLGGIAGGAVGSTLPVGGIGNGVALSVETLGGDPVTFDDIAISYTYDADEHPTCEPCTGGVGCLWALLNVTVTGLACDWDVVSGTWGPGTTSSSNAQAMTKTENPYRSNRMQATGKFNTSAIGDEIKVFLAGGDIVATFEVGEFCGVITISGPDGSNDIVVAGLVPDDTHYFCVKYDGVTASASVTLASTAILPENAHVNRQVSQVTSADITGLTAGLGTGTMTGEVTFTSVYVGQYYELDRLCTYCFNCTRGQYGETYYNWNKCEFESRSGTLGPSDFGLILLQPGDYAFADSGQASPIGSGYVRLSVISSVAGQKLRVFLNSDSTGSTGPWGQIDFGVSSSLISLSSGNSVSIPKIAGEAADIALCLSGTKLTMSVDHRPGIIPPLTGSLVGTGASTGPWVGVKHVGSGVDLEVTYLIYGGLRNSYVDEACHSCTVLCSVCLEGELPGEFLAELEGFDNVAVQNPGVTICNLNGAYVLQTADLCSAVFSSSYGSCADICDSPYGIGLYLNGYPLTAIPIPPIDAVHPRLVAAPSRRVILQVVLETVCNQFGASFFTQWFYGDVPSTMVGLSTLANCESMDRVLFMPYDHTAPLADYSFLPYRVYVSTV